MSAICPYSCIRGNPRESAIFKRDYFRDQSAISSTIYPQSHPRSFRDIIRDLSAISSAIYPRSAKSNHNRGRDPRQPQSSAMSSLPRSKSRIADPQNPTIIAAAIFRDFPRFLTESRRKSRARLSANFFPREV